MLVVQPEVPRGTMGTYGTNCFEHVKC